MLLNYLFLLVFILLATGAGWLTWRAIHAKKLWVKIAGGVGAGLLTLLFAAIAFIGGKGMLQTYFPGAPKPPDLSVEGTAEQIARGEYIVYVSCINCHSAVSADGMPTGAHPISGGFNLLEAEDMGFIGELVAENLTPGGKLAGYSDGELFRALRYNVDRKGRKMAAMAFMPYGQLSDEDIQAIIAYLRSLPAAENAGPTGDDLNYIAALLMGAGMFGEPSPPAPDAITAPPQGATVEYGEYVASFGECRGCHGPDMTGKEPTVIMPAIPNARPYASSLTQEQFVEMMRTGVKPGGVPFPPSMPWQNASKMTDIDLAALYAYLSSDGK